jgi:hypothetical protein
MIEILLAADAPDMPETPRSRSWPALALAFGQHNEALRAPVEGLPDTTGH